MSFGGLWDDPLNPTASQQESTAASSITEIYNQSDDDDTSEAVPSTAASTVPPQVNAPARDFLQPDLAQEIQPEPSSITLSSHPWSQATIDLHGPSISGTYNSSPNSRSTRISQHETNALIPMMQQMIQSQTMTNNLLQSLIQAQLLQQRQSPQPPQHQHTSIPYHPPFPRSSPAPAPAPAVSPQRPTRPRRQQPPIPDFLNDTGLSFDPTPVADDEAPSYLHQYFEKQRQI